MTAPLASMEVKTGVRTSFVAKSWGFKALGIFEAQPKSYYVNCTCCTGPTKQFEGRAYPIDEWELSVAIDLKKPPTQWSVEVKITPWEETSLTLKTDVLRWLATLGFVAVDFGTRDENAVDYPDFARAVAEAVAV